MPVPCVRVPREEGEATRQRLEEANLLSETHDVGSDGDWLYIPIADPDAAPSDLDVVPFDAPERDTQTMPSDLLSFEPSYERLGDIVIVDEDDAERAAAIAAAIMESDIPAKTVVNKASKVKGETRVRDWEVLAGDGTETVHREYGTAFALDLAEVYFSPRLATERHRVVEQVETGEHAFD
ncbi:MAG: SAM-dependent methyltransferase, partial [Halodesulfurarchaeum sp.]